MAVCEGCGRSGPTDLRFGIEYCPDCMRALRTKDADYFDRIGLDRATKRARDDIRATVLPEAKVREKERQAREQREARIREAIEKAGGYWEYKVVSLYDNDSGALDIVNLESTINVLGRQGWRLRAAYANELGRNSNSSGVGGISSGTNSTIDQNVLIFERFVSV